VTPFETWGNAATNIQSAIDASLDGDVVWVTNGIYATGGRIIDGDLTNRIAIVKPITVRSVNGPAVTVIKGAGIVNGTVIGPAAVRGAWLTNGAVLSGFTIQSGGTRDSGDANTLQKGGGVWGVSTNALLTNCVIVANAANSDGAGGYQITMIGCNLKNNDSVNGSGGGASLCNLLNCVLTDNKAVNGAGAASSFIRNSALTKNVATQWGGGAYSGTLINCTCSSNSASSIGYGGGAYSATLTNCILYWNAAGPSNNGTNVYACTLAYCCSFPIQPGPGNIATDPLLIADGAHLSSISPCRGAGTASVVSGNDVDGQNWLMPPSIGCDEWQAAPAIAGQLQPVSLGFPPTLNLGVVPVGQQPFAFWWYKDGVLLNDDSDFVSTHTTNLLVKHFGPLSVGDYQVVVSNTFGVVTSSVFHVAIHFVDKLSSAPFSPFLNWTNAAMTIQEAVDVSAIPDFILVTNGVYSSGGTLFGGTSNRVVISKLLTLHSINGPALTLIQGAWDPRTNGPLSIRCVVMNDGAHLNGFALNGGATWGQTAVGEQRNGGGAWGTSTSATLDHCWITGNAASASGGGAHNLTLKNCKISGNRAGLSGGGASFCTLKNCAITANFGGSSEGGGAEYCYLINCTVTSNSLPFSRPGPGISFSTAVNTIIQSNFAGTAIANYNNATLSYCCASPLPPGSGNISSDPQLMADGIHIAATSPCRGVGTNSFTIDSDIDDQNWSNPPSIGCDEWLASPAFATQPTPRLQRDAPGLVIGGVLITGQEPLSYSWSKNGFPLNDDAHFSSTQTTNLLLNSFAVADAGNYMLTASNAFGVTTASVQVTIRCVYASSETPMAPYTDWTHASTNIQNAIDVCVPGDVILVTNGFYGSGGRAMIGDLTNRVALITALSVASVNGPNETIIQGAVDPMSTNGPLAVRCAWLADKAVLKGFTLQNGGTRAAANLDLLDCGGGVLAFQSNAAVINCIVSNNSAGARAGGVYGGTLSYCKLLGNASSIGGGAALGKLLSCYVQGNSGSAYGGGIYFANLLNCTVTSNSAPFAAGLYGCRATNCIVYDNIINSNPTSPVRNYDPSTIAAYTCTTPPLGGSGNISSQPQLINEYHLTTTSPCFGAGTAVVASGNDLDGEMWKNPPSIGCDELWELAVTGPLLVGASTGLPEVVERGLMPLAGQVFGRATRVAWSFGDGSTLTNASYLLTSHQWTNAGDYIVTFTAFNIDNPAGVSTNLTVHVIPIVPPSLSAVGLSTTGFSLAFPSQAGAYYVLEKTTNLTEPVLWQTISTNSGTGILRIVDPNATNASGFYRIRIP